MPETQEVRASTPPLSHIFGKQSSQTPNTPTNRQPIAVDIQFYTNLTDQLLDQFYPKFCCKEKLTALDGKRTTVLRCPHCHKQQTRLSGTPLHQFKLPRWMFSYLLKESQLQYPKVITTVEISKRVGVSKPTARMLKRRLQLFASETLPRMQRKFYQDNKLAFHDFRFPKDKNTDLTEIVKDKQIPQADTVVLYSCGNLANKGRKRFKRKGQTSSIYMSESLGGEQRGTLVQTLGVKRGPVFYESIPDSKAQTVNPLIYKYIPVHNPIFTDMGYSLTSMNHRTINHSLKSSDKRNKWSRERWSKNGIHNNVAEGKNGILKRSFGSYVWINPKHSRLYLNEYSFLANLKYYSLEDLLPPESQPVGSVKEYQLDDNWQLRGMLPLVLPKQDSNLRHGD